MTSSAEQIEDYLGRYGWVFDRVSQGQWMTGWQGRYGTLSLSIGLSSTMICFKVEPLFQTTMDWDHRADLLKYICEINAHTPMVKLVIEEDGDISLVLQLWAAHLRYKDFEHALGLIGYYSDMLYEDLTIRLRDQSESYSAVAHLRLLT